MNERKKESITTLLQIKLTNQRINAEDLICVQELIVGQCLRKKNI